MGIFDRLKVVEPVEAGESTTPPTEESEIEPGTSGKPIDASEEALKNQEKEKEEAEALEETTPGEESETKAAEEETEAKDNLAGFANAEELAKGFQNLQKKFGEQGTELGELRKKLNPEEVAGQLPEQPATGPELTPEQFNEQFYDEFADNPGDAVARMTEVVAGRLVEEALKPFKPLIEMYQKQQTTLAVEKAYTTMADKYKDDFNSRIEEIDTILKDNPQYTALKPFDALEVAYKLSIANNLPEERTKIEADVKTKIKEKQNAYVSGTPGTTGAPAEGVDPDAAERARLAAPRKSIF